MKVLVIEDDDDIREVIVELLVDEGFEPLPAANAGEALTALRSHVPDAILLDLLLPGVQGRQVLTYLELMPSLSAIPVIVMTAGSQPRVEGHPVLRKPFAVADILGALRAAVAGSGSAAANDPT